MIRLRLDHRIPSGACSGSPTKRITAESLNTIVLIILLLAELVSGSAEGSHCIFRTKELASVSSWFDNNTIPRGGGIGLGRNKRSKKTMHIQALDDEILWLEQQLRRVEQEKRTLKAKTAKRQQIREDMSEARAANLKNKSQKAKSTQIRLKIF